ncbi:hypothetical protein M514_09015 [Trichuris suis]|uniref:Mos1 transposase HTH domain-containing protein n=1 Tax=Trichuris suis TaxID=68888 RepID=A0A085MZ81_9BILA|nr:hypothetical protein M513_09015 [Trichuris suis]KFD62527.1 hypothetical protein M514_09015 [Trichuris suis]
MFLTKLEWQASKTIEDLQQVYGSSAPSNSVVYEWIERFTEGIEQGRGTSGPRAVSGLRDHSLPPAEATADV